MAQPKRTLNIGIAECARRTGVRELLLELMEWNPVVTRKFFETGAVMLEQTTSGGSGLWEFFVTASKQAEGYLAFERIHDEVRNLMETGTEPTSAAAQAVASKATAVCREYGFGDPFVYVRWMKAFAVGAEASRQSWDFLISALDPALRRGTG